MQSDSYLIVTFIIPSEYEDQAISVLDDLGFMGSNTVEENSGFIIVRAYFTDRADTKIIKNGIENLLTEIYTTKPDMPPKGLQFEYLHSENWADKWKANFPPLAIDSDIIVVPPWRSDDDFSQKYKIIINPGMGFGTAQHPSTILCLKAMRKTLRRGDLLLDFGSGSGILSIFGYLLGAVSVDGIEVSGSAIDNALENLRLNNIDSGINFYDNLKSVSHKRYDVIVANIDLNTITGKFTDIYGLKSEHCILILSGIEESEMREFTELLRSKDINEFETRTLNGWAAVIAHC